jgi:hypothetical protein
MSANASAPVGRPSATALVLSSVMAVLGGASLVIAFVLTPQRAWVGVLLASNFLVGLGVGGLVLVALLYVTSARWSLPFRRVPEAMTAALPVAAIGLAAVLVCCPTLFSGQTPGEVSESPLHRLWFNRPFFLTRSLVYLALWIGFAFAIVANSRRQDTDRTSGPTQTNHWLSALFLVVFGVTCWLASMDWLMSLEPHWASTMFAVYNFAGLFLSALAAVIVLVVWLRWQGPLRSAVNENHLQDLGTLLFAFSSFWAYTWYCQYMLIWYVNNPEETAYYRARGNEGWQVWLLVDIALNWAVPFVVLLFRLAKRSPWLLGTVALLVLVGRWVDLSLMILPSQANASPMPSLLDAGLLLGTAGVFVLAVFGSLRKAPVVPPHVPVLV